MHIGCQAVQKQRRVLLRSVRAGCKPRGAFVTLVASTNSGSSGSPAPLALQASALPTPGALTRPLERREFDWSDESYNKDTRSAKIWHVNISI